MKRKLILFCAAAALVALGCSKELPKSDAAADRVEVGVTIGGSVATKATGSFAYHESTLKDVQVFCFDKATGVREDYKRGESNTVKLSITTGTKRIYALANCPDLGAVTTEASLLSTVTSFSNNSLDGFEMISPTGSATEQVITGSGNIELSVKRIVAKVLVDKLVAAFEQPSLRPLDFVITKIYMVNVAKNNNYGLSVVPNEYYQGGDNNGSRINGMIAEEGLSYNLKNGGSSDVQHGFYVYPNSSSNRTKVVIEGTLKGDSQMYAFELPAIERNKVYDIQEIRITRPSSDNMFADLDVTIRVADWDETVTIPTFSY